jgi:hypothetical protein
VIGPHPEIANSSYVSSGGTAIAIAFKADEISTTSPEAKELFIKGLTYSTQYARYNESLEFFDAALAIDRNFSEAWVAKGVALHNMKRYDEAIGNYDRALAINPGDAGTWHLKGITFRDWGKPEEAAACDRQAAELDPAGYGHLPGAGVAPAQTQSCVGRVRPVPEGGDVYIGESCLDVIAGVQSGQGISWYKNGRNPGNPTPDATRIIRDARNFFADPEEFLGYEGPWYIGSTDKVAFVIKVVDLRLQPWDNSTLPSDRGNQRQDPGSLCNIQVADSRIAVPANISNAIRDPIPGIRYSLNESESGRTIVLGKGDVVEINLRWVPGVAWNWIIPVSGCGLELEQSGVYSDGGDFWNVTGHYRVRYRAVSPGTSLIDGTFGGTPGGMAKGMPTFNLTVIVK